ncbi:MAG TPA: TraB/GumN family protein [Candidatus Thermoplasmatota archaeon]|nr:TraB/GumN family protein [Candidatus Thermoplasmatota archaeon]
MPEGPLPMRVDLPGVVLVGTAHVSAKSVEEVKQVLAEVQPDTVVVELDPPRYKALMDKQAWEETPMSALLKGGQAYFVLAQTLLASHQKRMSKEGGADPGAEMLEAVRFAEGSKKDLVLADRDIGVTFKRAWRRMGAREKGRISWEFMKAFSGADEVLDTDEIMEEDALSAMMEELARIAPSVKTVVLDERDAVLASRIQEARAKGGKVVAVLGAGHVAGVAKYLEDPRTIPERAPLETVPPKGFPLGAAIGFALIGLVIAVFAWQLYLGVTTGDFEKLKDIAVTWALFTGGGAALGALAALAHPLSILSAMVVAPLKPLRPTIGTGPIVGFIEAWLRKPTIGDFQAVRRVEKLGDFYRNRVLRVLLVAAFTGLGAQIGFLLALTYVVPAGFF